MFTFKYRATRRPHKMALASLCYGNDAAFGFVDTRGHGRLSNDISDIPPKPPIEARKGKTPRTFKTVLRLISFIWTIFSVLIILASEFAYPENEHHLMASWLTLDYEMLPFSYFLRVFELAMLLVFIARIFGVTFKMADILVPFFGSLVLTMVTTAGVISWTFGLRDDFEWRLKQWMPMAFANFHEDIDLAATIQQIQYSFMCCGLTGPNDWENVLKNDTDGSSLLPISCCGKLINDLDSSSYMSTCQWSEKKTDKGCLNSPVINIVLQMYYGLIVALGLVNLATVFFAFCLIVVMWNGAE